MILDNRMKKKLIFLFLCSEWMLQSQTTLLIKEWETDSSLKGASIGFSVIDLKNTQVIEEYHSHQFLIPASTLKVVTTAAALSSLGKNFQYETSILSDGHLNPTSGLLTANLIIKGSGDPTLQSEHFYANQNLCDNWAKALKEKGVKSIEGKIIADTKVFDKIIPDDWIWADISNYFGSIPNGLSYKDNKFKIVYNTGAPGTKAQIVKTSPNYLKQPYHLTSEVTIKGTEDLAYVYGNPFDFTKTIRGTLPANKTNYDIEAALPNPALLCAEDFYIALNKIGISCHSNSIETNDSIDDQLSSAKVLYSQKSPTLEKIIYYTNVTSNNLYCESLLKTIGGGSTQQGIEQVKKFIESKGLNKEEVFMVDGSGLSRANNITTAFQAQLLSKIYQDTSLYSSIYKSLPIAGKNGSLSSIGKGTFIENNMRAKTGYINRCRAYCGYVKTKSNKHLAFSIIFNNYNCTAKEAKLKIEKFLVHLGEL